LRTLSGEAVVGRSVFKTFLESDVFGREIFEYDSMEEALEALRSLAIETQSCYEGDGIEREVGYIVDVAR